MDKLQERRINGDLLDKADTVYMNLFVSNQSQGLDHTSTSGKVPVGTLTPAGDQSYQVGVESEEVVTGMPATAKDDLITALSGEASFLVTDLNPHAPKYAMGTTGEIQWNTTTGITPWADSISGSSSTKSLLYVAALASDSLVENDVVRVELSEGGNVFYFPGIVGATDSTAKTISLKHRLPEIPVESATVVLVGGYTLHHGGNTLRTMTALVQCDFPKGDQHLMEIPSCSATGGYTRQMSGAVKTPISLKMYGTQGDIGALTDQVILARTHVQFANYTTP